MEINILHLLEGAKNASGLTVVIDVFRAFSVTCYLFENGAKEIISVGDIDLAYKLKKDNPEFILIGERKERIPPGFDYGNSPTQILDVDFTGKTIVHTTSSGTQGLVNASNASMRLTGSFVNAPAIVKFIKNQKPAIVSLVCMGYAMQHPTEEDSFCAGYIKASLEDTIVDFEKMKEIIRNTSGRRLFIPENQNFSPETDFDLCTQLGRFNFIIKAEQINGLLKLNKITG